LQICSSVVLRSQITVAVPGQPTASKPTAHGLVSRPITLPTIVIAQGWTQDILCSDICGLGLVRVCVKDICTKTEAKTCTNHTGPVVQLAAYEELTFAWVLPLHRQDAEPPRQGEKQQQSVKQDATMHHSVHFITHQSFAFY